LATPRSLGPLIDMLADLCGEQPAWVRAPSTSLTAKIDLWPTAMSA
jgi:hypothetical protein